MFYPLTEKSLSVSRSVIQRGALILRRDGIIKFGKEFIKYIHWKIRHLLPKKGFQTRNSVKVKEARLGDGLFGRTSRPNNEDGMVSGHERYTQQGDSVVTVGGGHGVTGVRAAKIVKETGSVTVFEGGKESVETIKHVASINGVRDVCTVNHAIVGQERNVYGGDTIDAEIISPANLPKCDVLELDCEGAEIDVLKNLEISPRVVIVELHPWLYSDPPQKPIELLEQMGYDVQYYSGHDGVEISKEEFDLLLEKSCDKNNKKRGHVESGARWPVVAGGVLCQ